ncbi:MFS transporter, DHA1 family, multidrug resistance protein [Paenibacillus tianmuensis]|uniref:MFS transporter, DHA1 family, multidrug resistance protein n=1 Tax=Paenibacillus tianmuensis TaxID=624147 RepID=A0A1G4PH49_9BACL|nr:MFS transporter [Paenibacillus tianmuensis]SCW31576.1 MFS transporter, DHA1 family, multidrug resistance protein [Paenibacillus tianmuensis]
MTKTRSNWGPLVILMVNMFITMVGMGLIIPILPKFMMELGATGREMGYLIAAMGVTQLIFSPIGGEMSDKYGRKFMIVLGIGVFTLSQLLFGLADQMWLLYVSRMLSGIGAALLTPAMMAYVADITVEEERGKGLGLFSASMSLGIVIGPGIGGFLAEYGLRVPFYVAAAVAGVSVLLSLLFLPETQSREARHLARTSEKKRENLLKQMLSSFRAPYFMLLLLVFMMTFGLMGFESVISLYVTEKHGFTPKDISLMITLGALAGVFTQAVLFERLLRRFSERQILMAMFLLAAVMMLAVLAAKTYVAIFAVTILFFVATTLIRPAVNTLLSKMAGNEQGFVAGMNNAYMSLGTIAGPAIAGVLFDVNVNYPYVLGAAFMVASMVMVIRWKESPGLRKQAGIPAQVKEGAAAARE